MLSKRWKANFSWTYGTGQAYTQPTSYYKLDVTTNRDLYLIIGEDRNVSRLPNYHRMDIGIRYQRKLKKRWLEELTFYFQIYNLYNRRNIWFRNVNTNDIEKEPPEVLEIRMLPIIPTFGFEFYF